MLNSILIVLIISVVTILLRGLPFIIFCKSKETPKFIKYFSKVLPFAIMGMLVVYCLKDIKFDSVVNFVPALIGVGVVIVLQATTKKSLISIVCGTVIYMVLLNIL